MEINIYNVREEIFFNSEIKKKLNSLKNIFDQWNIANNIGGMNSRLRMLELKLINSLNDEHKEIINEHFGLKVKIKKISNNLSQNYKFSIEDQNLPKEIKEFREFCVSANQNNIYLTLWR